MIGSCGDVKVSTGVQKQDKRAVVAQSTLKGANAKYKREKQNQSRIRGLIAAQRRRPGLTCRLGIRRQLCRKTLCEFPVAQGNHGIADSTLRL